MNDFGDDAFYAGGPDAQYVVLYDATPGTYFISGIGTGNGPYTIVATQLGEGAQNLLARFDGTAVLDAPIVAESIEVPDAFVPPDAVADLVIGSSHVGHFMQGQAGLYTLTVRNSGAAATSGAVTVADILPTGLLAAAISGNGWTCDLTTVTATAVTHSVHWRHIRTSQSPSPSRVTPPRTSRTPRPSPAVLTAT